MRSLLLSLLLFVAALQLSATSASSASPDEAFAALEAGARSNDVEAVRQAIEDGASLNARGGGGQTPIMAATLSGSTDVVRDLLTYHRDRIDLTIGEKDGYTPMHGAAFQGRAEIGRLLLAAGLDPNDRHKDGYPPIHRACWGSQPRHTDTVKMLLEDGKVDVNVLANGQTPLDAASAAGNAATAALLKSRGGKRAVDLGSDKEL